MLKLKLQYSGHLMQRTDSLENTLMLGKIEGGRRRGQRDAMVGWHHWLSGHEFAQSLGVDNGPGSLACCSPWRCRVRQDWVSEVNWTWAKTPGDSEGQEPMGSQRVGHAVVTEQQSTGMAWYRKKDMLTSGGLLNFHLLSCLQGHDAFLSELRLVWIIFYRKTL